MDLAKKEEIEARLRDLIKENRTIDVKTEKRSFHTVSGNVIRRRKGHSAKRII